jgi:hypothetical protein
MSAVKTGVILSFACAGGLSIACTHVKDAGRTVGHTTREVTTEVGHTTRDVVKEVGHGAREVTTDIGHGTRDAVKSVGQGMKDATKPEPGEVKSTPTKPDTY